MYEVRKIIERGAVRKIICTMQSDDGTMAQRVAAWRDRYFADLQNCPFSQADTEMHEGMIALTDNRHLVKFYRECCNQMELFRQKTEECENRIEKSQNGASAADRKHLRTGCPDGGVHCGCAFEPGGGRGV